MDCKPLIWLGACLAALPAIAQPVQTQIEQARRFDQQVAPIRATESGSSLGALEETAPSSPGDSDLGTQAILRNQFAPQRWLVFGEIAGYYTNNVALTRRSTFDDYFMVATFGASYRPKITEQLEAEITARGSQFRYREYDQLNFTSLDFGGGLSYRVPQLGGVTLFARYNFNDLISEESGDEFFQNHTITTGAQKIFPLARAHAIVLGAAAQWGFADPEEAERDEYSIYAGYHVELTRSFHADLFYRAAYYRYSAADRDDVNQNVSASVRYRLTDWASVNASASFGFNRSSEEVFDYDVINSGGGLAVDVRF
jgi:hypothetical protein